MNSGSYTHYSSSIGRLTAHMCFMPKYRHKIFMHARVKELCSLAFDKIAKEYDFTIKEKGFDIDHVHLVIELGNNHSASQIARLLKGISARMLFRAFPWLKKQYFWGGHLWSPAYYFDGIGYVNEETITNYVKSQEINGNQQRSITFWLN